MTSRSGVRPLSKSKVENEKSRSLSPVSNSSAPSRPSSTASFPASALASVSAAASPSLVDLEDMLSQAHVSLLSGAPSDAQDLLLRLLEDARRMQSTNHSPPPKPLQEITADAMLQLGVLAHSLSSSAEVVKKKSTSNHAAMLRAEAIAWYDSCIAYLITGTIPVSPSSSYSSYAAHPVGLPQLAILSRPPYPFSHPLSMHHARASNASANASALNSTLPSSLSPTNASIHNPAAHRAISSSSSFSSFSLNKQGSGDSNMASAPPGYSWRVLPATSPSVLLNRALVSLDCMDAEDAQKALRAAKRVLEDDPAAYDRTLLASVLFNLGVTAELKASLASQNSIPAKRAAEAGEKSQLEWVSEAAKCYEHAYHARITSSAQPPVSLETGGCDGDGDDDGSTSGGGVAGNGDGGAERIKDADILVEALRAAARCHASTGKIERAIGCMQRAYSMIAKQARAVGSGELARKRVMVLVALGDLYDASADARHAALARKAFRNARIAVQQSMQTQKKDTKRNGSARSNSEQSLEGSWEDWEAYVGRRCMELGVK
eukprot:ANDGO_01035.mRNA.1 hypothetical protein